MTAFEFAKNEYLKYGIDVEVAMQKLKEIPVSMHCWQGDDVNGFVSEGSLSGGIQTTGNYPGKARNFEELKADIESRGGKVVGSMSGNVNYLVNNDINSTSSKNIAAKQFGIPIITEEQLQSMF